MITKITGKPISVIGDVLTLAVGAFEYEVLIPEFTRRQLQEQDSQLLLERRDFVEETYEQVLAIHQLHPAARRVPQRIGPRVFHRAHQRQGLTHLEHIDQPDQFAKEVARILKPGGAFLRNQANQRLNKKR